MSDTAPRSHSSGQVIHGVLLEVDRVGTLITGEAGVGKSELALELISRGHCLIADDIVDVSFSPTERCIDGKCPNLLRDFLEVRGLGLLNIRAMYGHNSVKYEHSIDLVINLKNASKISPKADPPLIEKLNIRKVLGFDIPELALTLRPGHNLAVMVEAAARNFLLLQDGYDANGDFQERMSLDLNHAKP